MNGLKPKKRRNMLPGYTRKLKACLIPLSEVDYALPTVIGDYTGFYTSTHHSTNVGKLFLLEYSPLPYLSRSKDSLTGALDMQLEVLIQTSCMLQKGAVLKQA